MPEIGDVVDGAFSTNEDVAEVRYLDGRLHHSHRGAVFLRESGLYNVSCILEFETFEEQYAEGKLHCCTWKFREGLPTFCGLLPSPTKELGERPPESWQYFLRFWDMDVCASVVAENYAYSQTIDRKRDVLKYDPSWKDITEERHEERPRYCVECLTLQATI